MSYYSMHVFVCTHNRASGVSCGGAGGSDAVVDEIKLGVSHHIGKTSCSARVSRSGCMGRCAQGPVLVIYPEATWYRYASDHDLNEIIDSHFANGQIVKRLQLVAPTGEDRRPAP